jgi:hypothetical protein
MYPIDDAWSERMHAEAARGYLGAKLAFTRLSFNYYISEAAFRYVLDAVHLVADEGWKLLPLYRFDPRTGLWVHRAGTPDDALSLTALPTRTPARLGTAPDRVLRRQLAAARRIIDDVHAGSAGRPVDRPVLSDELERIRWFALPGEGLPQPHAG